MCVCTLIKSLRVRMHQKEGAVMWARDLHSWEYADGAPWLQPILHRTRKWCGKSLKSARTKLGNLMHFQGILCNPKTLKIYKVHHTCKQTHTHTKQMEWIKITKICWDLGQLNQNKGKLGPGNVLFACDISSDWHDSKVQLVRKSVSTQTLPALTCPGVTFFMLACWIPVLSPSLSFGL